MLRIAVLLLLLFCLRFKVSSQASADTVYKPMPLVTIRKTKPPAMIKAGEQHLKLLPVEVFSSYTGSEVAQLISLGEAGNYELKSVGIPLVLGDDTMQIVARVLAFDSTSGLPSSILFEQSLAIAPSMIHGRRYQWRLDSGQVRLSGVRRFFLVIEFKQAPPVTFKKASDFWGIRYEPRRNAAPCYLKTSFMPQWTAFKEGAEPLQVMMNAVLFKY